MGLRRASVDQGNLVLIVNDPESAKATVVRLAQSPIATDGSAILSGRWEHQFAKTIPDEAYFIQTVLMLQNSRMPNSLSSRP